MRIVRSSRTIIKFTIRVKQSSSCMPLNLIEDVISKFVARMWLLILVMEHYAANSVAI